MDSDDEFFLEDDVDVLDIIDRGFPRKIYNRKEHFNEMDDFTFFRRFRLQKETVLSILQLIEGELEYPHNLNNSVSPVNQLLAALRFYASAGHLSAVGDFIGMHDSTASRIVRRVSKCIAQLYKSYVKMPSPDQIVQTQTNFYNIAGFPRVIRVIDGTHIRIQSPGGDDAEIFRNRKGYFSLNTQIVCDQNLKFLDVIARWPGSAHDNTVFNQSRIRQKFENGRFPNCVLLGDSGYAQRNYLLTPIGDPLNRAQRLYNESQIRTRNTAERCIGVWKRRFPVVAYGLRLKLDTSLAVVIATTVLHNIAITMHEPVPLLPLDIDENELNYLIQMGEIPDVPFNNHNDIGYQQQLINEYFANL